MQSFHQAAPSSYTLPPFREYAWLIQVMMENTLKSVDYKEMAAWFIMSQLICAWFSATAKVSVCQQMHNTRELLPAAAFPALGLTAECCTGNRNTQLWARLGWLLHSHLPSINRPLADHCSTPGLHDSPPRISSQARKLLRLITLPRSKDCISFSETNWIFTRLYCCKMLILPSMICVSQEQSEAVWIIEQKWQMSYPNICPSKRPQNSPLW